MVQSISIAMPEIRLCLVLLLSFSVLASTSQPPYDCSAIQVDNFQYNLSALGGDYEVDGFVDRITNLETTTLEATYAVNICEDLNSAFCVNSCPTSGNGMPGGYFFFFSSYPFSFKLEIQRLIILFSSCDLVWATYNFAGGYGSHMVSKIGTLFGRPHPLTLRPRAKLLEGEGGKAEGLVLEFFFKWDESDTPHSVAIIDLICDPTRSGHELLRRTGYNPDWVGKEDEYEEADRNNVQNQTPSLRFLDWNSWYRDNRKHSLLHLEWKTRLVCDSHVSRVSEGNREGGLKQFLGKFIMRPWEQFRLEL